ncbi:MAG: tetratricopeptide repeat protein [Candidatus Obscuribacterales bacterium]|jgi:tetratricopeptide (TPR) repeat protein
MHLHFIFKFSKPYELALYTLVALVFGGAAVAASDTTQTLSQEIKSFNDGNYLQTVSIGKELVAIDPTNATARYYYGQALAKLNRGAEAIAQFSQCYKLAKDPQMKSYSLTALQNLNKALTTKASSSSSNTIVESTQPSNIASNSSRPSAQGAELSSLKLRIFEDGAQQIKVLREQADRDIQSAKNHAQEQMQGVPEFLNRPYYVNGINTGKYPNPEYPEAFEKSQAELASTTAKINSAFTRRESEIMADCKRRTVGYDQTGVGMRSQQTPGISNIQLTPEHTNTYLRQYVNYDGSVPSALKARAGALSNDKQKSNTSVPRSAK